MHWQFYIYVIQISGNCPSILELMSMSKEIVTEYFMIHYSMKATNFSFVAMTYLDFYQISNNCIRCWVTKLIVADFLSWWNIPRKCLYQIAENFIYLEYIEVEITTDKLLLLFLKEKHHRRIPVMQNYTLTGLYPNTLYYVWLAARSQRGEGATTIPYEVRTKQYGKQSELRNTDKSSEECHQ